MLSAYHIPLPESAEQEDWWKDKVHQVVWYQDDTEHDNDETYQHQWRIDTEGILNLIVVYTQQDRYQNDANQPGIFYQQLACHNHEVLGNRHSYDTENNCEGYYCHSHDKAWTFCHKTFLSVLEHTMLHELGNHDADGKEIEEDGDEPPKDDDTKEDEDDTNIPL